jgi:transposase
MHKPSEAEPKVKNMSGTYEPAGTIGIDVGDRLSHFCVLDGKGDVVVEGRVATTKEAMRGYFASLAPSRIALECGTHSGWISRLASDFGHEVIVANARELRKIHQSNRKNDRADAQVLARMARVDPKLLAPIQHRSAQMQADLAIVRARDVLVRMRTKCVNATRGLVKTTGSRLSKSSTHSFARRALEQVPDELQAALLPLITIIEAVSKQITEYDRKIEVLANESYPKTQLLRQVTDV